ncbi:pyridoxal phosphate-dependent aminotransferase, partial [bacterium]|nr:pyridoxal phosphate-dependent aminotransferase [bacterium]
MKLSKRVLNLKPSATLAQSTKAKNMIAEGIDVANLSCGEPDFDTPRNIKEAAKKYIDQGFTKYTQSGGIPELRQAICDKLERDNNLVYEPKQVVVTCGAKQALYNAIQAIIDPGDEVIMISPYWVTYPDHTILAGGTPVVIETSHQTDFKISPDDLQRAITPKTRAIIFNTPSNPTGSIYTFDELREIGDVLKTTNVTIIADDIYEKIVYENFKHVCIATACPELMEQTLVVNGLSKSHSMTGWRMGYVAGPHDVMAKIQTLQVQQISGITSFVQKACIEALNGPQIEAEKMV